MRRRKLNLRHGAAAIACAVTLAGAATAVAPQAASARAASSCGSKTIQIKQKGAKTLSVPVSQITVEGGATCAEASQVIRGALLHKLPSGWVLSRGNFKVAQGLTAQVAVNGHKRIKYATVGG